MRQMSHGLRSGCNPVYKAATGLIVILSGFLFLSLSAGKSQEEQTALIGYMEIPEDRWTEIEWQNETPVEHDFFQDPNQKYLHISFTDSAAAAVANHSRRSGLEEEEWELRRLYDRSDSDRIAAFARSDKGRELYVYTNDRKGFRYLVAADRKEGEGLTYTLGNGRYSYDSDLEWTAYQTRPVRNHENGQYTFIWNEDTWIYDPVYLEESACAMEAYLTGAQAPEGNWELMEERMYVGTDGYLADVWYTSGMQEAHLFVDIWNKQYAMIEVIPADDPADISATGSRGQVPSYTIQTEEWIRLDRHEETWDESFRNAGEWHYAAKYEQLAARAVQDYAEKKRMEGENWTLRRMDREEGSLSAYVCSGSGRELYLLLDEEDESYLVTVDWRKKELPESGDRYQYSEDSRFVWTDYRKWYDMEQEDRDPEVAFCITGDDGCYEHNFQDCSAYALKDYLYSVAPDNRDTWVYMQGSFYMGKNRCIGAVWYTDGKTKIHMLVNMYNSEYMVLEVFRTGEREAIHKEKGAAGRAMQMPRIADVILTGESCHALCEDGTVWTWSRWEGMDAARMLQGLKDVVKILDVGASHETIYALTADGHVYGWGRNERLICPEEEGNPWKVWYRDYKEPVRIAKLSGITELDGGFGKAFALDQDGTFYMWGLDMYRSETGEAVPGFPQEQRERMEGVETLAAGGGYYNNSYFVKKDGTVLSIMEGDRTQHIGQYIFPIITEEWETADMSAHDPVSAQYLQEDSVTELGGGSITGEVLLYEAGKCGDIEKMASDGYTVFCYLSDGSLYYWDNNRVRFHDDIQVLLRPESKREDYRGCWKKPGYEEVPGDTAENDKGIRIADTCSSREHVLFLTEDGHLYVSEYVTEETANVEYYWRSPNLIYRSEITYNTMDLKTVRIKKLDLEHIKSINTDGDGHFSAVDEKGRCYDIREDEGRFNCEKLF